MAHYAHWREGADPSDWHNLEDHLQAVAEKAATFANAFGSGEWGYLAGLWHDVGKYHPLFQRKAQGESVHLDHSVVGAALAVSYSPSNGWHLAFPIAGHHTGLADLQGNEPPIQLSTRVGQYRDLPLVLTAIPTVVLKQALPNLPPFLRENHDIPHNAAVRRTEFWIRFLFSALVDADWLDTEAYFDRARGPTRRGFPNIRILTERLNQHLSQKALAIPETARSTKINRIRAAILSACECAASQTPGFFSLTAPTGAGKTLSSMSFALNHAERHSLSRVIVVLPYTSIIEQNAAVYRTALGVEAVVEHHSNFDPKQTDEASEMATKRILLASENWDATVIVTTTVQFFESLFSNRPSRCRKLHNIARSVIILDEVQALPSGFLLSIVEALNELVLHYGCTVVLSTATPPALEYRNGFEVGFKDVRHLVSDPASLSRELSRVEYHWPHSDEPAADWSVLAHEIARSSRCMAVVHRRKDARDLANAIGAIRKGEPLFHLSALMCAAHRAEVLKEIRSVLAGDGCCRLVATQLVEAGVDIDFPVVWRALGGLDSIVQAAGRCNREGKQAKGDVYIFRAPTAPPRGTPTKALNVTSAMLAENNGSLDLTDTAVFDSYFRRLYMIEDQDKHRIQTYRQQMRFATVAREFQMIEDDFRQSVIVPYGGFAEQLNRVRLDPGSRDALRGLQRFSVQISTKAAERLRRAGAIEEIVPGVLAIRDTHASAYDRRFGLITEEHSSAYSTEENR